MALNNTEALTIIQAKIQATGGPAAFSSKHDIAEPYVRNVLAGRTEPGKRTAKAAGLVKQDGAWRWM